VCRPISLSFASLHPSAFALTAFLGSLWRFWLRGTSADEHRKGDEGLDGTFHLCHILRREAPVPAMLHAVKLWVGLCCWPPVKVLLLRCQGANVVPNESDTLPGHHRAELPYRLAQPGADPCRS